MVDAVLFSSATGEWATPEDFFKALHREFVFTLDAAASDDESEEDFAKRRKSELRTIVERVHKRTRRTPEESDEDFANRVKKKVAKEAKAIQRRTFNAKIPNYLTERDDALSCSWEPHKRIFLNPPYSRGLGKWVAKAREESDKGAIVVVLIPARTDTKWFDLWITRRGSEVRFVRGRLKFGGSKNSAPFPSMVVVMRPDDPRFAPLSRIRWRARERPAKVKK